ncbi:MAG: menaquinone biosynthesis protein [Deltaproteobacteria bacterium]
MGEVKTGCKPRARIGMVNFINTAPLYEIWQRTVIRSDWLVTEAPPTTLNRMLHAGELDLGFVSSHEYASRPDEYRILSDLSISATGPVGSVLLLCRMAPAELDGRLVVLSSQSQTSASLVKIVLEEFYGVTPRYISGKTTSPEAAAAAAVLAIGDEALRLRSDPAFPVRLDLGLRTIADQVAPRIPMSEKECYQYLRGLEYDLGEEKQAALRCFFEYLIKSGEASVGALPFQICG